MCAHACPHTVAHIQMPQNKVATSRKQQQQKRIDGWISVWIDR